MRRKREELREWIWPASAGRVWTHGGGETWFGLPRYFPALLRLLSSKALRGDRDLSRTYLSLFALHEGGVVDLGEEDRHAELAGFVGNHRGIKSWRERLRMLEGLGFIHIAPRGSSAYGFALLLDPLPVVERLRKEGRLGEGEWAFFCSELLRLTPAREATQRYGRDDGEGALPSAGAAACLGIRCDGLATLAAKQPSLLAGRVWTSAAHRRRMIRAGPLRDERTGYSTSRGGA